MISNYVIMLLQGLVSSMQDKRIELYFDILKTSEIEVTTESELFGGLLEGVSVTMSTMTAKVTLHFPNVLSIQNLLLLDKAVNKYFLAAGFKGTQLELQYDNPAISNEALSG